MAVAAAVDTGAEDQAIPAQTLEDIDGKTAAELLREVIDEAEAPGKFYLPAGAEGYEEEDAAAAVPRKCRPLSLEDYYRRLRSFRPGWWFAKPIGVSPVECSRRGWTCTGPDLAVCECCGLELRVVREGEVWLVNGKPCDGPPADAALIEGHSPFCPWRSHSVDATNPAKLSAREIVEATEHRLQGLKLSLQHMPMLADGQKEGESGEGEGDVDSFEALARAGWEHAGFAGAEPNRLELLRCFFCLRTVAVQAFSHRPAWCPRVREEGSGEPKAKASRHSFTPPRSDVWTPRPGILGKQQRQQQQLGIEGSGAGSGGSEGLPVPSPSGSDSAEGGDGIAAMDPHALHRFFCPMFSRAKEDLSPVAAKVIHARIAAAMEREEELAAAAARASAASQEAGGVASGGADEALLGEAATAESAAARAQELLDELYTILPPK